MISKFCKDALFSRKYEDKKMIIIINVINSRRRLEKIVSEEIYKK